MLLKCIELRCCNGEFIISTNCQPERQNFDLLAKGPFLDRQGQGHFVVKVGNLEGRSWRTAPAERKLKKVWSSPKKFEGQPSQTCGFFSRFQTENFTSLDKFVTSGIPGFSRACSSSSCHCSTWNHASWLLHGRPSHQPVLPRRSLPARGQNSRCRIGLLQAEDCWLHQLQCMHLAPQLPKWWMNNKQTKPLIAFTLHPNGGAKHEEKMNPPNSTSSSFSSSSSWSRPNIQRNVAREENEKTENPNTKKRFSKNIPGHVKKWQHIHVLITASAFWRDWDVHYGHVRTTVYFNYVYCIIQ